MTTITIRYYTKSGREVEATLPARYEVCSECHGEGTELRGGLKGAVFSAEDFAEDPEFAEAYFGGRYDVKCSCCQGQRVELVIDTEYLSPHQRRHKLLYDAYRCRLAEQEYADRRTRYWESGGAE